MSQPRPTRYRAPAGPPPRPPMRPPAGRPPTGRPPAGSRPPAAGGYELLGPDGRPPKRRGPSLPVKAAGVFLLLVLAFAGYVQIAGVGEADKQLEQPPRSVPAPSAGPSEPPTTFKQAFDVTFRYADHVMVLRSLSYKNLNRKNATVTASFQITPSGEVNARWIEDKRRYSLAIPNRYINARKITVTRNGTKRSVQVQFRWPRALLYKGSRMLVQLPTRSGKPELVTTSVEVPRDHTIIEERHGAGGL